MITGDDLTYALGYAIEISDMGAAKIELSRYDIDVDGFMDVDTIDTISFGLEARF